jgi:hypothetical protein
MKKLNKLDKILYILSFFVILLAVFAIGVGLDLIEIGEYGIHFTF